MSAYFCLAESESVTVRVSPSGLGLWYTLHTYHVSDGQPGALAHYTVCPKSLDPFHKVTYCEKWGMTSWTDSTENIDLKMLA